MAARYLSSVAGNDSNNGTTKALAKATWAGAISVMSAGDDLFVDSAHAQVISSNTVFTFPGTLAAPNRIYSFDWTDAVEPPTTLLAGATVSGSSSAITVAFAGTHFFHGFNMDPGLSYSVGATSGHGRHTMESCDLRTQGTGSTGQITLSSSAGGHYSELRNCRFRFSGANNVIKVGHTTQITGGSFISGTTSPTALLQAGDSGRFGDILIEGLDCTNLATGFHWIIASSAGCGTVRVRNAKLPSGWSGSAFSGTPVSAGLFFEMDDVVAGSTVYRMHANYAGQGSVERAIYRDGGADDGAALSWRLASTANASFPAMPFASRELPAKYNSAVGSSKTVTVEIVHDGASPLTDGEVWLELSYRGESGQTITTLVSDRKALLSAGAPQASSAATWTGDTGTGPNGSATWNTLKLEVTFTAQEVGYLQARVYLAKASTTVFVDPKMTVA